MLIIKGRIRENHITQANQCENTYIIKKTNKQMKMNVFCIF